MYKYKSIGIHVIFALGMLAAIHSFTPTQESLALRRRAIRGLLRRTLTSFIEYLFFESGFVDLLRHDFEVRCAGMAVRLPSPRCRACVRPCCQTTSDRSEKIDFGSVSERLPSIGSASWMWPGLGS